MTDGTPPSVDVPEESVLDDVFGDRRDAAEAYVSLLLDEGMTWGLIGPREADRIWQRHVLNSAAVASLVPEGADVLDVGSGAGLPGIPLALARPDAHVTLLEPLARRVEFLELAVSRLGLEDQVVVMRGRAEDFRGGRTEIVTCRAVAPLGRLIEWCWPLVGSELLAIKGASAADEVRKNDRELRKRKLAAEVVSVRAHTVAEPTTVIRVCRQTDL